MKLCCFVNVAKSCVHTFIIFKMRRFSHHMASKSNKVNLSLPERWEKYTTIGKVVPGTRFLPFKTPLKEEICRRSLPERQWFTPAMLLKQAPNVKLIVDLTQTDRFYTAKFFADNGVRHLKIVCPGGGKFLPSQDIVRKFSQTIKDFLASEDGLNEDSLIGVHCTHGLNRTGYLICKYMVEHNGVAAKDAIEAFEDARGHKIERELYKKDILDPSSIPTPATIPQTSRLPHDDHTERHERKIYSQPVRNYSDWRNRPPNSFDDQRIRHDDQRNREISGNFCESHSDPRSYNWRTDRQRNDTPQNYTSWRRSQIPAPDASHQIGYNYTSSHSTNERSFRNYRNESPYYRNAR